MSGVTLYDATHPHGWVASSLFARQIVRHAVEQ